MKTTEQIDVYKRQTIEKGEVVGFLGPNGAGKSTTMNIITGYLSSTEGEVLVDGLSVLDNPEKAKQKIGYLPEMPPLYTDMTVNEYLNFVCDLKKVPMSKKAEMITKITKQVRINDVRKRLIRNLSKGYKPVSYTHLDVYKRQNYDLACENYIHANIIFEKKQKIDLTNTGWGYMIATDTL